MIRIDLISFNMSSVEKDTSGIEEYAGSAHEISQTNPHE